MVDGEHELRDRRGGHRFDEARARANDARVLRLGPDHESGNILNEQQRHPFPVGVFDEIGHLLGTLRVDDAADPRRFVLPLRLDHAARVRDHRHLPSCNRAMPADHFRRDVRLELVEPAGIE